MDQKTAIEVNYDDYVWEIDDSPANVVVAIEAARKQGSKFVELTDDRDTNSRIWLSVDNIMAVYDWRDDEQGAEEKEG
jgi:hypothetical protein